ncbi:MAG TPA: protein kinase [Vicinamibacteria bacterium]|nr:protein kinase [Vicinamibacteria bacterium]
MIGEKLGQYRILRRLGAGGMAEVFVAEDSKLKREVALKLLPPDLAQDPDFLSRFEREAQALAALTHPNIVTIYSVEEAEGLHFLTMELIHGVGLDQIVSTGPLSTERCIAIATQMADALAAAHARGIVHRDLKPGNVVISDDGRVKILDFGLAKMQGYGADEDDLTAARTAPGIVLGTLSFMSPEQLQGSAADARSDVFSFGVTLYEMASGHRPFKGGSTAEVMSAILRDQPRPVTELTGKFPTALERIIRRCLEKNPDDRYSSAIELRQDIQHMLEAGPARFRFGFSISRKRLLPLLATLLVFATAVGSWFVMRARPQTSLTMVAVLPFENFGPPQDSYFAAGVSEEITSRLSRVRSIGIISRKSTLQYEGTTKSVREIGDELDVDFIVDGTVRWSQGSDGVPRVRITPQLSRVSDDTSLWAKTYDRVLVDIFQTQSEIAEDVLAQLGVTIVDSERSTLEARPTGDLDAYEAYLRGRHLAQTPDYSPETRARVVAFFQESVTLDPDYVPGYVELSRAHSLFYHLGHDLSDERRELAKAAAERAYAIAPDAPEVHVALGFYYYWVRSDYALAMREFEIAEAALPSNAEILEAKALVYRRQGRWDEAIAHFRRALPFSPRDASLIGEIGETYANTADYDEAIHYYDRAIALSPEEAWLFMAKAWTYWMWKGATAEARDTLEAMPPTKDTQSVWMWFWQETFERDYDSALERLFATDAEWIGFPESYSPRPLLAAHAFRFSGQPERARHAYEEARVLLEEEVKRWPDDPRRRAALGIACAALGRAEEAVREGRMALKLHPLTRDAFSGAYYVSELAFIYTLLGERASAIDLLEDLLQVPSLISVPMLELDPRWDPLRDEPRFQRMLTEYR